MPKQESILMYYVYMYIYIYIYRYILYIFIENLNACKISYNIYMM